MLKKTSGVCWLEVVIFQVQKWLFDLFAGAVCTVFLGISDLWVFAFAAGSWDQGSDPLDHGYPLRPLSQPAWRWRGGQLPIWWDPLWYINTYLDTQSQTHPDFLFWLLIVSKLFPCSIWECFHWFNETNIWLIAKTTNFLLVFLKNVLTLI